MADGDREIGGAERGELAIGVDRILVTQGEQTRRGDPFVVRKQEAREG